MLAAFQELQVVSQPVSPSEVVAAVSIYAERLQDLYKSVAVSAATKFLWLRFPEQVQIYDSLAWQWLIESSSAETLRKVAGARDIRVWYPRYLDAWETEYKNKAVDVAAACERLTALTYVADVPDEEFLGWMNSGWFRKRVFDRYMIMQTSHA